MLLICEIARKYFKTRPALHQLLVFILLTNHGTRLQTYELQNDMFVIFYIVASMWALQVRKPLLASLLFSLALSNKAGAIFFLPALFGIIQYLDGTFMLIKGVCVILGV